MSCPECGSPNSAGAKFCANCGIRLLEQRCTNCDSTLSPGARFCSECGQPTELHSPADDTQRVLLARRAPPELAHKAQTARELAGERRVVTSMFADVVGSTSLAERLDPEDWATIMNIAFERITRSIYAYEGTVARLMGDALLAFFGAPVSHEDDPERAVRAGLDLLAEVRNFAEELRATYEIEFQMRVGINTGDVVVGEVGSELDYEYTAMGDAINLAARMEQTAEPGTVQISEFTYNFVAPLFDVEPLGDIKVKGKRRAVKAFKVLKPKASPGRSRGIAGLRSPLVGRQREIQSLEDKIAATFSGRGQIIGLIGEAGLGKSRLIEEVGRVWKDRSLTGNDILIYRGVSFERDRPFGLFRRFMLERFGVNENQNSEATLEAIRKALGPITDQHESTHKFVVAVGHLLGWDPEVYGSNPTLDGPSFKKELFEGILGPMRHRLELHATLFIFDDLHWADPASVELAEEMLKLADNYPAMILFATRPDRSSPGWQLVQTAEREYYHRSTQFELVRLSPEDTNLLFSNLLDIKDMPANARTAINEKAEGNPFFVEEILRTLLESSVITQEDGKARWMATLEPTAIEIPDNVNALLMARIDMLDAGARRTLQYAAVIGRHFSESVLERISDRPEKIRAQLNAFERQGLVLPAEGHDRYGFRHDLTREAAYSSILRKQRPGLHLQVGEVMEEIYSHQLVEQAPLLAQHFDLAGDLEKARRYALLAGGEAARVHAVTEAIHFFSRVIDHGKARKLPLEEQAAAYQKLGRNLELASRFEEAYELYDELDQLAVREGNKRVQLEAMLGKATLRVIANTYYDPVEGQDLLENAIVLADELGDTGSRAKILWQLMLLDLSTTMDVDARLRYGEEALALARQEGLEELTAFILHDLWYAYGGSGQWDRGIETLEEACAIWRKFGNLPMLAESLLRISLSFQAKGDDDIAIRYADEAFAKGLESDNADQKAISRSLIGWVYVERGEWTQAIQIMEETIAFGKPISNVTACIGTRSELALLYLEMGLPERARAIIDEALAVPFDLLLPFALSAEIELHIYNGELEAANSAAAGLSSSTDQKRRLGAMTPLWVRSGLAHTKLALARDDRAAAARNAEMLVVNLESEDLHYLLAEARYLQGLALLTDPDRLEEAEQVLHIAEKEARQQKAKRTHWKILAQLGRIAQGRGDKALATSYFEQSRQILESIVEGLEDAALCASFMNTPAVRAIYNRDDHSKEDK